VVMVDCVGAVGWHPSWSIVASCSGSYHFEGVEGDDVREDNCVKVWVFE
jgi:hypothetical protein